MKLKNVTETVEEAVDPSTGEISLHKITTSKTFTSKVTGAVFYNTFLDVLDAIYVKLTNNEKNVLYFFMVWAEVNTGEVMLPQIRKDELCDKLNIKKQSLYNLLQQMQKKEVITVYKGKVTINPIYFWKGSLKAREEYIEKRAMYITMGIEEDGKP